MSLFGSAGRFLPSLGILLLGLIWVSLVELWLAPRLGDPLARAGLYALFVVLAAAVVGLAGHRRTPTFESASAPRRESFLREIQSLAHVGCWEWEIEADSVEWSEEMYRICGIDPSVEMSYERFLERVHPDDRARVDAVVQRSLATGEPFVYEERIVRPDGSVRVVYGKGRLEPGGRRMFGVFQDVTERTDALRALRESEEELLEARKMEGLGRLAAGFAHDFNNLLTAVRGYTDVVLREAGLASTHREALEEVMSASHRAEELVRRLLAMGRERESHPTAADLNAIVQGMRSMIAPHLQGIRLETRLAEGLWPVRADPIHLEQVILNLAVNATHAMPGGGTLEIRTANETPRESGAALPRVRLEIRDTGQGIPEDARPHVFEPFFSTKGGKGSGLGLAMVHSLVRQNGGTIDFVSEAGRGTTFVVRLPRHVRALESEDGGDGGRAALGARRGNDSQAGADSQSS